MSLRYISVFSGIGGLEDPVAAPLLFCERDEACQSILRARHPQVDVCSDITELAAPPAADLVAGGWPCQDLSSAGTLGGITAKRSGLFFDMLRVARDAGAHTLVGENVPNLLTMNMGRDFGAVLGALTEEGFAHISWRVLNARSFGLPQERRRLFIVASRDPARAAALHAPLPQMATKRTARVGGFYWTGGKRSICFSPGYSPALKIGATDNKGRAPVAILVGERIRKLTANEFLRLQGFSDLSLDDFPASAVLRMAGNAVPRPVGHFVMKSVQECAQPSGTRTAFGVIASSGVLSGGLPYVIEHPVGPLADNLGEFVDLANDETLSAQAAAGLLVRSVRSGHRMPRELFDVLSRLALDRSQKLKASRGNSFEALDAMTGEVQAYSATLPPLSKYKAIPEEADDVDDESEAEDD